MHSPHRTQSGSVRYSMLGDGAVTKRSCSVRHIGPVSWRNSIRVGFSPPLTSTRNNFPRRDLDRLAPGPIMGQRLDGCICRKPSISDVVTLLAGQAGRSPLTKGSWSEPLPRVCAVDHSASASFSGPNSNCPGVWTPNSGIPNQPRLTQGPGQRQ